MEQQLPRTPSILGTLRRRAWLVALCCILVPVSAFAFSKSQTNQYTASTSLLFRDAGFDQTLFGSETLARSTDPAREAATNLELVSLDAIGERTARRLPAVDAVKDSVEVSAAGQSDVVSVEATDGNPETAARIANVFAEEYIGFRREADRAKITAARDLVNSRLEALELSQQDSGPQARSLRDRLQQLDILASLQTGNAEVAEAAEPPSSPSSPKVGRNTLVGALLGALLGIGLALLAERLDRRLRDAKEMEEIFERPILGAIPASRTLSEGRADIGALGAGEGEAFRMMRANLRYFNVDQNIRSVLITSAAPGDGKTTVAMNLAATASVGSRVLLIEADLRHPAVALGLGLSDVAGLSTVLAGEAEIADVVRQVPVPDGQNGAGQRTLDVLLAGPLPPNPSDLLESERMREVIATAERQYDLVVVDTPPTSVVSDAIPLVTQVGGVIVVGRMGKSTRDAAEHLRNQLRNLDAPILGVVVNVVRSDSGAYGYAYGYAAHYGTETNGSRRRRLPKLPGRRTKAGTSSASVPPREPAQVGASPAPEARPPAARLPASSSRGAREGPEASQSSGAPQSSGASPAAVAPPSGVPARAGAPPPGASRQPSAERANPGTSAQPSRSLASSLKLARRLARERLRKRS